MRHDIRSDTRRFVFTFVGKKERKRHEKKRERRYNGDIFIERGTPFTEGEEKTNEIEYDVSAVCTVSFIL
jgi:hypothetical protein